MTSTPPRTPDEAPPEPLRPDDESFSDPFEEAVPDDDPVGWAEDGDDEATPAADEDPFEVIDDEDGTELEEPATSLELEEAPPSVDDQGGTDDPFDALHPEDELATPPPPPDARPADPRPILPWRTTAHVDGEPVPTILAPSMPASTWRGAPEGAADTPHTIELAGLRFELVPETVDGAPLLILGRDALEGRVLVEV